MTPTRPQPHPGDALLEDADEDGLPGDRRDVKGQPFTPPIVTPSTKNR
jgi:hypothetical protein